METKCLGISTALPSGRTECVPPRKPPFARSPGLSPEGHLALARPPEGRAPHARKGRPPPHRGISPPGPARSATHRGGTKCLGIRTALPRGRAERVPPRKPPLASSPGSRRKAISPWIVHPAEGRAPHARKGKHWLQGGFSPLGSRPPADASGGNEMPRHQYSLATRTHRARPSEKTAHRAIPGPFSGRPSRLGSPPGGAGSARPQTTFPIP